jgi:hypothetical protein
MGVTAPFRGLGVFTGGEGAEGSNCAWTEFTKYPIGIAITNATTKHNTAILLEFCNANQRTELTSRNIFF